jgi:hypothetical protein
LFSAKHHRDAICSVSAIAWLGMLPSAVTSPHPSAISGIFSRLRHFVMQIA